jgi:hypothetical protein
MVWTWLIQLQHRGSLVDQRGDSRWHLDVFRCLCGNVLRGPIHGGNGLDVTGLLCRVVLHIAD